MIFSQAFVTFHGRRSSSPGGDTLSAEAHDPILRGSMENFLVGWPKDAKRRHTSG
jgi:hypothetical protein